MSPSTTQVCYDALTGSNLYSYTFMFQISKIYEHLRDPAFSSLKGVAVLKSYALQGEYIH